ncbi:tripartite tricarboxylate transporter TctB family protein [Pseudothermotoga sp.]
MSELVASICFLISGFVFFFESRKIRVLKFGSLGGDFLPKMLSIMTIVVSIVWLISSVVKLLKKKQSMRLEFVPGGVARTVVYLVGSALYIFMLDLFGFFVPSVGISLLTYLLLKERIRLLDFLTGGIYSLVMVTIVWLLFTRVLGLILPAGRLI